MIDTPLSRRSLLGSLVAALWAALTAGWLSYGGPRRPGAPRVALDAEGIPWRASLDPQSPDFWPHHDVIVTIDGKVPGGCRGWDRRSGYVECDEVEGQVWWQTGEYGFPDIAQGPDGATIPVRRYGAVDVRWAR